MNNETDCDLHSFAGSIICVSDESGANIEGTSYLTTQEVMAQVAKTYSESDVKPVFEKIPQLYKYKWTDFTDLGKLKHCLINVGRDRWADRILLICVALQMSPYKK